MDLLINAGLRSIARLADLLPCDTNRDLQYKHPYLVEEIFQASHAGKVLCNYTVGTSGNVFRLSRASNETTHA